MSIFSMNYNDHNKVFVLGGAQTDFERNWTKEGKGAVAMLKEVLSDGLKDVGLTFEDIRKLNDDNKVCCCVGNFIAENYISQGHLGALLTQVHPAFYGVPSARYEAASASGSAAIDAAMAKLRCGDYDLAIVTGFELMKTVNSKAGSEYLGRATYFEKEAAGVSFPLPKVYSRLTEEFLAKYGTDEKRAYDAMAKISVINFDNAKRNPMAQTRKWFMDYAQASHRGTETNGFVGGKLAVSDCSRITDGAAVVILASERFTSKHPEFQNAPFVKGFGHRTAPMAFSRKLKDQEGKDSFLPWTKKAVEEAYARAGMTVDDIDCFEVNDGFTFSEYEALSALGLSEEGKEYEAVESGLIAFDGKKPVNPSGGLIGCGHPAGATGVRMFLDLYKQVSGRAGRYQVKGAKNAMMLNVGGVETTNYTFIIGK